MNAVSVDVWWGIVEGQADNRFDWSYYDHVFGLSTAHGLRIAPIPSFHQCGGNVGDECQFLPPPGCGPSTPTGRCTGSSWA